LCAQCGIASWSVSDVVSDAGCHDDAAGSAPSSEQGVDASLGRARLLRSGAWQQAGAVWQIC
jgi:hypothetical protein